MYPTFRRHVSRPTELQGSTVPDLVDGLVAGDDAAYRELVHHHGPRMLAVATRYLHNTTDAADAVQCAFVCVVRSIARFQRGSSLQTWLHRIVANCCLMELRRRKRKPSAPLADRALEAQAGRATRLSFLATAHQALEVRELASLLREALDALPREQREVLLLRDVGELGLLEISGLLQLRISTVKWRLLCAHRALRIALRPQVTEHRE